MRQINKTGLCKVCSIRLTAKDKRTQYCPSCAHSGERNNNWKGDAVGIDALHAFIRSRLTKPEKCVHCNDAPPIDLANKSGKYKRDVSDWEWLCRRCHMISDGRLDNFLSHSNMNNKLPDRICLQCGKQYAPHGDSRKFCSKPCSTRYYNLNIRVYKNNDASF